MSVRADGGGRGATPGEGAAFADEIKVKGKTKDVEEEIRAVKGKIRACGGLRSLWPDRGVLLKQLEQLLDKELLLLELLQKNEELLLEQELRLLPAQASLLPSGTQASML